MDIDSYIGLTSQDMDALADQIKLSRKYPYVVDLGHDGVFVSAAGLYGKLSQGPENGISFESQWHTDCHAFKWKRWLIVFDPRLGYQKFTGK